jgi:hypothetical protein
LRLAGVLKDLLASYANCLKIIYCINTLKRQTAFYCYQNLALLRGYGLSEFGNKILFQHLNKKNSRSEIATLFPSYFLSLIS